MSSLASALKRKPNHTDSLSGPITSLEIGLVISGSFLISILLIYNLGSQLPKCLSINLIVLSKSNSPLMHIATLLGR